jgi:hypothetical protein
MSPIWKSHTSCAASAASVNNSLAQNIWVGSKHKHKERFMQNVNLEQEVIDLSKEKWRWMSERKVDSLDALVHEKAVFVHMGGTMSKEQELDVIRSGGIHYKNVDIQEASVRFIGTTTAILLNKIRLVAVVGGNEVTNPFVVTDMCSKAVPGR